MNTRASFSAVFVAVLGFAVWGCEQPSNPTEVALTDQGGTVSLATSPNATFKFSDSFSFSFFNECTGEVVSGVVGVKSTVHISPDANGGFHAHFHDIFNGSAVGETSGIQYVGPQADHDAFNASTGGALEETYTVNFRFLSRGGTDNILTHVLFHITITPSGVVTSETSIVTDACKG